MICVFFYCFITKTVRPSLISGCVQQLFCPFVWRQVCVWVWAGSCSLGENVSPGAHQLNPAADHLTLCLSLCVCVCLLHHLRRKIWSRLSTFTALTKAMVDEIIFRLYRLCISARRIYMLHKHCCLWSGANTGKYLFFFFQTLSKWSKIAGAFSLTCQHQCCFVVVYDAERINWLRGKHGLWPIWKNRHSSVGWIPIVFLQVKLSEVVLCSLSFIWQTISWTFFSALHASFSFRLDALGRYLYVAHFSYKLAPVVQRYLAFQLN